MSAPYKQNRRRFMKLMGQAMGLGSGASFLRALPALPDVPQQPLKAKMRSAIVVGGGIAGLSAAYGLLRKGVEVTLLERHNRVGGLIITRRWDNGLYTEDGAEDIVDSDEYLWKLIRQLGVDTEELEGADALYFRGVYAEEDSFEKIVEKLPLAPQARRDLWQAIERIRAIHSGFRHPYTNPNYHAYDWLTFQGWLAQQGWHPDVNRLMDTGLRAEAAASTAQMNTFEGIDLYSMVRDARWFHVRGGNHRLPEAIARALGGSVRLDCHVTQVEQSARDVRVSYRAEGALRTLRADVAIFAVPARVVVELARDLPGRKQEALLAVPYQTYLNPALRFLQRFWKTLYGMKTWALNTDTFLNYIVDQTFTQQGSEGILVLHIAGDDGAAYGPLKDQEILDLCLDQLASLWPRAREYYLEGRVGRIGTLRYPYQRPGFLRDLAPVLEEPVGRFYFSGDYTNGQGDLNGACFSGLRVATLLAENPETE